MTKRISEEENEELRARGRIAAAINAVEGIYPSEEVKAFLEELDRERLPVEEREVRVMEFIRVNYQNNDGDE
ncbi:MAG: hypothetical protein KDD60_00075 [Bdellovibrionales bacterium]|nr:hypothetical protein [Bdellovibrionales bacterium]